MKKYIPLVIAGACAMLPLFSCGGPEKNNGPFVPPTPDKPSGGDTTKQQPVAKVGEPLPDWTEGDLDIHFISTGRGESTLYIFPDSTSMLIDCGGSLLTDAIATRISTEGPTVWKPNASTPCEVAISSYIKKANPRKDKVDYFVLTHFDEDHMGKYPPAYTETAGMPKHSAGFYLNGIGELSTYIKFGKIIDRGYTAPFNRSNEERFKDYIKVLNWNKTTNGTVYEVAKPGSNTQIAMSHNPSKYPNFNIRILCSAGNVWTGTGENTKFIAPDLATVQAVNPAENVWSIGMMVTMGKFNMFTAGDLQYNSRTTHAWMDVESPLIPLVSKVEVMKADHHGTSATNCPELLAHLIPDNVVFTPWRTVQPNATTVKNMLTSNSAVNFFTTGVVAEKKAELEKTYGGSFRNWEGHVVIRVKPDGKYTFYILGDKDMNRKVEKIYGPLTSN